jgi:flagellar hook-length control protein FliK
MRRRSTACSTAAARRLPQPPRPRSRPKPLRPTPGSTAPTVEPAPLADAAPSTALPDQLLAMLGALAPIAAPSPTAAAPQGGGAMPAAGAAAPSVAATLPGLALAQNTAAAAPAALPADAARPDFATALADARGEATTAAPDAPAGLFAPPVAAPQSLARPVAAVPLLDPVAMPANPQAGLDDGFGSRIVWMAEQRIGHADIRVTPEHLGTIEVRVQLDGTQVRAEFFSAQADVRQALESSMNRLRDQLGQHGLQLAQADVGQQRPGNAPQEPGTGERDVDPAEPAPVAPGIVRTRRLLDEIA